MRQKFHLVLQASAILLAGAFSWGTATAQDAASPSIEEQLKTKYKVTTTGLDSGGPRILEAGAVLSIKKEGILGVPYGNALMAEHTYKDGMLHGISKLLQPTLGNTTRYLKVDDKVYVRKLDVNLKNDKVTFIVFECDSCNGVTELASYKAEVVFQFTKGKYVGPSAILESIGQVFALDAAPPRRPDPPTTADPQRPPGVTSLKVPGTYVSAQAPTDQLQLNADNSLSLSADGQTSRGTYTHNGNTLKISIPDTGVDTTMTIQGINLADATGQVWILREQSPPPPPGEGVLRNEDIIKLAKVIDDATIIAKITTSKCQFDTSTDALIQLKESGVSAAVLKAMVGAPK